MTGAELVPLIVIGVIVLLIVGGVVILRRRTNASVMLSARSSDESRINTAPQIAWRERVSNRTRPVWLSSSLTFHTHLIVIGLGEVGLEVLEGLAARLDDTLADGHPQRARFKLIHLHFDQVERRNARRESASTEIIQLTIIDSPKVSAQNLADPTWQWAVQTRRAVDEPTVSRYSARAALFNSLRLGDSNSAFSQTLSGLLTPQVSHVIFVGSALENASSLVGDLAALIHIHPRYRGALKLFALIALEEQGGDLLGLMNSNGSYQAATLAELGRFSAETQSEIQYGQSLKFNPDNQRRVLLNGVGVFYGGDPAQHRGKIRSGKQQIVNMVWGMAVNKQLFTEIDQALISSAQGSQQTPSVSVFFNHAVYLPSRFRRKLLAARLVRSYLRTGSPASPAASEVPKDRGEIDSLIEQLREQDMRLLDQARTFKTLYGDNAYLRELVTFLDRDEENDQLRTLQQQLETLISQSGAINGREVPSNLRDWLQRGESSKDMLRAMYDHIGWVGNDDQRYPITLLSAGDRSGQLITHMHTRPADFPRYRQALHDMATRIVSAIVAQEADNFGADPERAAVGITGGDWRDRYQQWLSLFGDQINGSAPLESRTFSLNQPGAWRPNGWNGLDETGTDSTFLLQGVLFPRVPVALLRMFVDNSLQKEHLPHPEEWLTHDLLGGQRAIQTTPLWIQTALSHQGALNGFARCWEHDALSDYLPWNDDDRWDKYLWRFIERYEANPDFAAKVNAAGSNVAPPTAPDPMLRRVPALDNTLETVLKKLIAVPSAANSTTRHKGS